MAQCYSDELLRDSFTCQLRRLFSVHSHVVPVSYIRVIRWVEEANDVAEQRRAIAKHQIEGDKADQTCRGRQQHGQSLGKRNTASSCLSLSTQPCLLAGCGSARSTRMRRSTKSDCAWHFPLGEGVELSQRLRSHRVMWRSPARKEGDRCLYVCVCLGNERAAHREGTETFWVERHIQQNSTYSKDLHWYQ